MLDLSRSQLLKGAPERRNISEFELRDGANGVLKFDGYAAVFDQPYEVSDRYGTFTETVSRNALARTLSRKPDVVLNINHDGLPLARTTAGTLRIGTDTHGYHVKADLEPRDPDVQSVRYKLERGDMADMSWAFRVTVDKWNDDETERSLEEVNVDGGDVSIVTTGANRQTTANLRGVLESLAAGGFELGELDPVMVRAAYKNVGALLPTEDEVVALVEKIGESTTRKTLSIRAAERALLTD